MKLHDLHYWIIGVVIGTMFILVLEMKILGAYVDSPVGMDGYCKIIYGEGFKYNKNAQTCSAYVNGKVISKPFSIQEYRSFCIKPKIISTSFFDECWYNGGSIN